MFVSYSGYVLLVGRFFIIYFNTGPIGFLPGYHFGPHLFFIFALMLSIPTLLINSMLWGQSDAVYAAGVVMCLYFILTDKPLAAVLAFSFAISVKLQAIFFAPVLIGYLLRKESTAGY